MYICSTMIWLWVIRLRTKYKADENVHYRQTKGTEKWLQEILGTASKLRESLHVSRRCLEACNMHQRASIVHTCWVACPTYATATESTSCQLGGERTHLDREQLKRWEYTLLVWGPRSDGPHPGSRLAAVHDRVSGPVKEAGPPSVSKHKVTFN